MKALDIQLDDMHVGDTASFTHTIAPEDVQAFAELSGDMNPLHTDGTYAAGTQFGGIVVHGMYLGALMSRLIGMQLPGARALLMKESLEFRKPARPGDTVNVNGRVASISASTGTIELGITITRGDETLVSGSANVRVQP